MPQHRVGVPDLLEVRPLAWSLLKGQLADRFSIAVYPFERIPALLRAGDLELGFVSAVDLLRSPDLKPVRDLGIALLPGARGLALSPRRPPSELSSIDCAEAAAWAVDLARAALGGMVPAAAWRDRLAGATLAGGADAKLLCGPAALRAVDALPVADIWHERTATPLPFGGWAAPARIDTESCEFALKSSLRYGLSSLETVASEAAAECGVGRGELESYYRNELTFVLDEPHREGLQHLRRALEPARVARRTSRRAASDAAAAAAAAAAEALAVSTTSAES